MRPIDSGNPLDPGAVMGPDLAPLVTGAPAPAAPSQEQPMDTPDPAAAAGKRMEQGLEVSYFMGQLGKAQPAPLPGVLYDNPAGHAGAPPTEIKHPAPTWTGMTLGTNQFGETVSIKGEIGSSQGYENRMEATAAARLNGAEPAVIVHGNDGKWHAFQTTAGFYSESLGSQKATDTPTREIYGLASSASVENMRNKVLSLKADLAQPHSQDDRDQIIQDLKQARIELASLTFGVPKSDITMDFTKPEAGKINLVPGNRIGGADGETDPDIKTGNTVVKINIDVLEDPKRAEVVQFHEGTHVQDDALAHDWYAKYQAQPNSKLGFEGWIQDQAKQGHIPKADADVVVEIYGGGKAGTEARAHVEAALTAFQAGDAEAGKREISAYAGMTITEHHKSGDYSNPKPSVKDELTPKLQDAYQHMSPAMQQELQAAIAAAQKENPEAWISQVKLPK